MPQVNEIDHARQQRDYWAAVVHYLEQREPAPRRRPRRASSNGRITAGDAAEQVLRAHDGPMSTAEIFDSIQLIPGVKMKDKDGMYKTLDRDKARFRRVGRGLWELARPDQEG